MDDTNKKRESWLAGQNSLSVKEHYDFSTIQAGESRHLWVYTAALVLTAGMMVFLQYTRIEPEYTPAKVRVPSDNPSPHIEYRWQPGVDESTGV